MGLYEALLDLSCKRSSKDCIEIFRLSMCLFSNVFSIDGMASDERNYAFICRKGISRHQHDFIIVRCVRIHFLSLQNLGNADIQ